MPLAPRSEGASIAAWGSGHEVRALGRDVQHLRAPADLSTGFTQAQRTTVSNAVLARCDARDGSCLTAAQNTGNAGGVNAALPASWAADRTRPLWPYPQVARYRGTGSLESADSFACQSGSLLPHGPRPWAMIRPAGVFLLRPEEHEGWR